MKKINKKRIIRQMFDIRHVDESGSLDWKKIESVEKSASVFYFKNQPAKPKAEKKTEEKADNQIFKDDFPEIKNIVPPRPPGFSYLGKTYEFENIPFDYCIESDYFPKSPVENKTRSKKRGGINFLNFFKFFKKAFFVSLDFSKMPLLFGGIGLFLFLAVSGISFLSKGLRIESQVLGISQTAYEEFSSAVGSVKDQDFTASSVKFSQAYENFSLASEYLNEMGSVLIGGAKFFPYLSKLSSGKNMIECGKSVSLAGKYINDSAQIAYSLSSLNNNQDIEEKSLLEIFNGIERNFNLAGEELKKADEYISAIKLNDLPEENRNDFIELKEKLPLILSAIENFSSNGHILTDLLGGNGPRKYLFLFQNNQEMRATGGFIGTYGLLDISNGHIKKFFIDGIFNPDGQLKDKVVPPKPIQKISAAWSLHDSNWFPDFPLSAEKAIFFYEKTGGPTADGVITFTPTVMQKLLEITGPISMEDYDVILDSNNFIEKTQYKVEVDYDEEENRPKKILADLAPIVLDKLFSSKDLKTVSKTLDVLSQALEEKHILLYSRNDDLQKIISDLNWSGKILPSSGDYLNIVHTNINGYKTDGIIDENIEHETEIQNDGSIIDTVTITRKHKGGNSEYAWWNKVNADYMRVYVPAGSQLLEAEGQTREFNDPPLDYEALKFKRDADVEKEENGMSVNEESGTRTYQDIGKTVFANWVYVSPQETVTVKYKYRLPFKLESEENNSANSYSLLVQKQSGSLGSQFSSEVKYPENYKLEWSCPDGLKKGERNLKFNGNLETDKFIGAVFSEE